MPTYEDLWRGEQAVSQKRERLPRRVRDWPDNAQGDFKRVKNELWKWAKKEGVSGKRLALVAYEAVKQAYEAEPEPDLDEWWSKFEGLCLEPTKGKRLGLRGVLVPDVPPGPGAALGPGYRESEVSNE